MNKKVMIYEKEVNAIGARFHSQRKDKTKFTELGLSDTCSCFEN